MTKVTIGNGVTSIGVHAFDVCYSLRSVYITDIAAWCNISFGNGYSNPLRYAGNLYLNNELVTDLIIPDGATKIGSYAFYDCEFLTSVTIPDSVTSIGDSTFFGCTSLTSVTIPDSVTSIGSCAFDDCTSLTSVTIGNGVTSIGSYAFDDCNSLERVDITDIVTWCGISFYDVSSNPLSYAHNIYLNGVLVTELIIPESVTTIGNYAFKGCTSLTSVTIGNGVTEIGRWAFRSCTSLTSVTIGNGVTSIGEYAFYDCTSLTSITIPDSVTEIGSYAFSYCTSLKKVYCKPTTPPTGGSRMFSNNASGRNIYVPSNSVSAYKSASNWSNYSDKIFGYDF